MQNGIHCIVVHMYSRLALDCSLAPFHEFCSFVSILMEPRHSNLETLVLQRLSESPSLSFAAPFPTWHQRCSSAQGKPVDDGRHCNGFEDVTSNYCEPSVSLNSHTADFFLLHLLLLYCRYGVKVDMWATGVVCYIMLSGVSPFIVHPSDRMLYGRCLQHTMHSHKY